MFDTCFYVSSRFTRCCCFFCDHLYLSSSESLTIALSFVRSFSFIADFYQFDFDCFIEIRSILCALVGTHEQVTFTFSFLFLSFGDVNIVSSLLSLADSIRTSRVPLAKTRSDETSTNMFRLICLSYVRTIGSNVAVSNSSTSTTSCGTIES
jgi:hypothetical protein